MRTVFLTLVGCLATATAQAGTIEVLSPGQIVPVHGDNLVTFDQIAAAAYGSTTRAGLFQAGGAAFSGDAVVMRNGSDGSLPALGLYAEPAHDRSNYLAIMNGGTETISYASERNAFGLYWGSIDTYNSVAFYDAGHLVASYAGSDLAPLFPIPFGDQQSDGSNRYVRFSGMGSFDSVVLGSGGNSFELDNITSSVPEPSTWVMMLLSFAALVYARSAQSSKVNRRRLALGQGRSAAPALVWRARG